MPTTIRTRAKLLAEIQAGRELDAIRDQADEAEFITDTPLREPSGFVEYPNRYAWAQRYAVACRKLADARIAVDATGLLETTKEPYNGTSEN